MGDYYATPELYDLIYAPYRADIPYVVRLAKEANGPVLEVACGDGRLLVPMVEAGVDADGLDLTPAMAEGARTKLAAKGLRANVVVGDMRDFTMPRRYRWILIGFTSFYHNLTQDDQLATLRCCREHLEGGGSLTIVAFHPSVAVLAGLDGTPKVTMEHDRPDGRGRVRVTDATTSDTYAQVTRVARTVEILDPAGAVERTVESGFELRYVFGPEMELLFRLAGFSRWEACTPIARYDADGPLDPPEPPKAGAVLAWRAWKD